MWVKISNGGDCPLAVFRAVTSGDIIGGYQFSEEGIASVFMAGRWSG